MHEAGPVRAVAKVKGMPQFMEGLLDDPLDKDLLCLHGRQGLPEAICGYDACLSSQLGLSIDVSEDGYKEVYISHCKDLEGLGRSHLGQHLKDPCGKILISTGIKGKKGVLEDRCDMGAVTEDPVDLVSDRFEKGPIHTSDVGDNNDMFGS